VLLGGGLLATFVNLWTDPAFTWQQLLRDMEMGTPGTIGRFVLPPKAREFWAIPLSNLFVSIVAGYLASYDDEVRCYGIETTLAELGGVWAFLGVLVLSIVAAYREWFGHDMGVVGSLFIIVIVAAGYAIPIAITIIPVYGGAAGGHELWKLLHPVRCRPTFAWHALCSVCGATAKKSKSPLHVPVGQESAFCGDHCTVCRKV
jgi:hypothetical protein